MQALSMIAKNVFYEQFIENIKQDRLRYLRASFFTTDIVISSIYTISKLFPRHILAVVCVSRRLPRFYETKKSLSQEVSQFKRAFVALPKTAFFSAPGSVL